RRLVLVLSGRRFCANGFSWRLRMDGKRVDPSFQLVRQRRIDHAMPLQPALSSEGVRYDIKSEVALAAGAVPGMAFMQMGFVLDMHAFRRESRDQLCRNNILHSHRRALAITSHER